MAKRILRHPRIVGPLLMILALPASTTAQTAESFRELQALLARDETVVVTDAQGRETRGRVADISEQSLTLLTPDQLTLSQNEVARVRRTDAVWNGMQNGFWIGLGAFVVTAAIAARVSDETPYGLLYYGLPIFPAAGAVTGILIDRTVGNEVIYLAPPRRSAGSVSPQPIGQALGLSVSFEF